MRVASLVLVAFGALAAAKAAFTQEMDCKLENAGTGTVRVVLDGRTFVLADGREVRLAAIEVPGSERPAQASKTALQTMLGGREVALKRLGADTDRHGRLPIYAFIAGDEPSAQHAQLAAGHARVAARVGDAACAAGLLSTERAARTAGLGLWSEASYAPRQAEDPAALLAERGRFTLIEGKVISVRESGGTIYVNFGRRWSEDFTATVLKRNERTFTSTGLDLKKLAGRAVRVRGFVEERGGPWIEVNRPEQIEVLD